MRRPDPRELLTHGDAPEWLEETAGLLRIRKLIDRHGWDVVKSMEGIDEWDPWVPMALEIIDTEVERLRFEREKAESRQRHLDSKKGKK